MEGRALGPSTLKQQQFKKNFTYDRLQKKPEQDRLKQTLIDRFKTVQRSPHADIHELFPRQLFDRTQRRGTSEAFKQSIQSQNQRLKDQAAILTVQLSKAMKIAQLFVDQNEQMTLRLNEIARDKQLILQAIVKQKDAQFSDLNSKIALLTEQNSVLITHLDRFQERLQQQGSFSDEARIRQKQDQKEELKRDLQAALQRQFLLAQRLTLNQQRLRATEQQLQSAKEQFFDKGNASQDLKEKNQSLEEENKYLKSAMKYIQNRIDNQTNVLKEQHFRLKEKHTNLIYSHEQLTSKFIQLQTQHNNLKLTQTSLVSQLANTSEQLVTAKDRIAASQRKVQRLELQLSEAKTNFNNLAKEMDELRRQFQRRLRTIEQEKQELLVQNQERNIASQRIIEEMRQRMRQAIRERDSQIAKLLKRN